MIFLGESLSGCSPIAEVVSGDVVDLLFLFFTALWHKSGGLIESDMLLIRQAIVINKFFYIVRNFFVLTK